ncbi:hypothetical protein FSP39_004282 [Pinctada imbricata]|uniref:Ankyrin repeat and sterile alpha motif domain-containing protein 1B n=1 Tax=Pinctada imbricata TaxID=66713 RepID=A0AA89C9V8_PINIB|nr:hypothetical protein FSP39_004282 [Pinctada imbricata]
MAALKHISLKFGDKDQELLEAARLGKTDVIEKLVKKRQSSGSNILPSFLKQFGNINCVDREGDTPLHLAALNGHKGAVQILLRENAQVNIQDQTGCIPLHLAAWKGYSDICLLLLNNQYEPVLINTQNNAGDTALHNSSQFGYASTVEVLLQHNGDPTIRNLKDDSPLDLAARFGRVEVVQCLITKYPDLVNNIILNHSPLHLAAALGHKQIVEILLKAGYNINIKTENGTALHVAAVYCKVDIVKELLERGIDPNEIDKDGLTVLQLLQQHEKTQTSYTEIISVITGEKTQTSYTEIISVITGERTQTSYTEIITINHMLSCGMRKAHPRGLVSGQGTRLAEFPDQKPEPEKHKGAKPPSEGPEVPYDTLVEQRPKPKPRPRQSVDGGDGQSVSALYAKPNKEGKEGTTEVASPVSPKEPPPIPPRQSSLDLPGDISPVHRTIAEVRQASMLMENLQPFQAPFSEEPTPAQVPPTHNSPPLPPKNRRNVVSMFEKASDFKASPKTEKRIQSGAPWKSEENILDSLPQAPPRPCQGEDTLQPLSGSYLDMAASPRTGRARPVKPPRVKKSLSPTPPKRSEQLKESNENEKSVEEMKESTKDKSQDSIDGDNPVKSDGSVFGVKVTDSAGSKISTGPEIPEDYEVMSKVDKQKVQTPEERHDNYMSAFSLMSSSKEDVTPRTTDKSSVPRSSDGFDIVMTTDTTKVDSKVVPVHSEINDSSTAAKQPLLQDDIVEYENTAKSESESTHVAQADEIVEYENTSNNKSENKNEHPTEETVEYENTAKVENANRLVRNIGDECDKENITTSIPEKDIPDFNKEQILQSDIPVNILTVDYISDKTSISCDSKVVDPIPKGDNCDNVCDNKQLGDRRSFTSENSDSKNKRISSTDQNLGNTKAMDEKCQDGRISNGVRTEMKDEDGKGILPKPKSLPLETAVATNGLPLSPTGYHQPPTPDHPPPSPHTAMMGIQQKIHVAVPPQPKRSSKDMETITEVSLLSGTQDDNIPVSVQTDVQTDIPGQSTDSPNVDDTGQKVKVKVDSGEEEVIVTMRKPRASTGSLDELVTSDSLQPFKGLLRGSVIGKPRKFSSQIKDSVPHNVRASLQNSLPSSGVTIEPVNEEEIDVDRVMATITMATPESRSARMSDDHDSEDDWAQIADIVSSFGGDIGVYADFASIEAEIEKLKRGNFLIADTLASIGAGITRASVFEREFQEDFMKNLSKDASKTLSVGDWLEGIGLDQYENTLIANGFDDTDFLGEKIMDDHDLETIGIVNSEHRKKILDASKTLSQITPINPDNPPTSVEDWLSSLHLSDYHNTFISKKYDTMDRVLKVWEVELTSVLDISAIGHRKRILASLENRPPIDRQFPSLKKRSKDTSEVHVPFKDINLYKDYTKVKPLTSSEEDIKDSSQNAFPPVDSSEDEEVFRKDSQGKAIRDNTIHLRPPHQAHTASPIKQWRHRPEMLIKGCCNYTAQYLGSTLVKELSGTESTREGISKLKKSADVIAKIPTIMLSISYKGVKFIDAKTKKVICDHEIGNIFCACQDAESMNFFAYITRDNQTAQHYCHVFNVRNPDMAREIILTLGEAFEVAYQVALKEKAVQEAHRFEQDQMERKLSQSDRKLSNSGREDSISISSKTSINTV